MVVCLCQGAAIGRNFYVTGGSGTHENDTFAYDTVANTYTELAALPQSLAAAQVTAAGGYLLLFGGRGSSYLNELQVSEHCYGLSLLRKAQRSHAVRPSQEGVRSHVYTHTPT